MKTNIEKKNEFYKKNTVHDLITYLHIELVNLYAGKPVVMTIDNIFFIINKD